MSKDASHHDFCEPFECARAYCKKHRLVYQACRTASWDSSFRLLIGNGDCPDCIEAAIKKSNEDYYHQMLQREKMRAA